MRLNCAIGMLSKLRNNANFHILKTAYHSMFESYFNMVHNYGAKKQ